MRNRTSANRVCIASLILAGLLTGCGDPGDGLVHSQACTATFTACGGDPAGTWDVVAVCVEGNLADEYNSLTSPSCKGSVEQVTLAASGSVTYTADSVAYKGETQQSSSFYYSAPCAEATFGFASLDAETCDEIQAANSKIAKGMVVKCHLDHGDCKCGSTMTAELRATNKYLIADSMIEEEDGSRYEFCAKGGTMVLRERIHGDAYVVTTLDKR